MRAEGKRGRQTPIGDYLERLDFGRKIHLKVDDGALLALCEDFGDDAAPAPRSPDPPTGATGPPLSTAPPLRAPPPPRPGPCPRRPWA